MGYSTIYKYPLPILDHSEVILPLGAEVIHIGEQDGLLYVWAFVDPELGPPVRRRFRIFGTGHLIPDDVAADSWRQTIQCANGLVWHVFEAA